MKEFHDRYSIKKRIASNKRCLGICKHNLGFVWLGEWI